ncbi:M23 family metallopeptidase [uncultured Friedmanniella sp.]|uniref:M23 family metallopeptidase n=1 Tax=uncultured Friedmanniella sp. TaxID=335381 RepID=UPI0035CA816D
MPTLPKQDATARRALIEDIRQDKRGWLQHGAAALAVSLLGLGIAGSVVLTGHAESTQLAVPRAQVVKNPAIAVPSAFDRDTTQTTSRSSGRPALDAARLKSLADQRAEELSKTDAQIAEAAKVKAADAREKSLESTSKATEKKGSSLVKGASSSTTSSGTSAKTTTPTATSSGKSCLPVTGGYSVAARFGQVGSWARYHTGFDFAAPVGTPLHAPSAGVVTNAGSGPASGWAGNYVAIRYPDGTSSLMAHMSTVSVSVGQSVSACQLVGAIGMTGRTFGPHVHFEIYPAGITPGDVYKAVNPVPWLNAHGLKP